MKTEDPSRRDQASTGGGTQGAQPPPISRVRRIVCAILGLALLVAAGWVFAGFLERGGRYVVAIGAATAAFGGVILLGSAVSGR